jgi:diguanylate cyclase (GGDEF)-like protein
MADLKIRFSLKKKLIILIVSIILLIILLAGLFAFKGLTDINRNQYLSRSRELSTTAASLVDPQRVKNIRDRVMEIYNATEDRVSTEDWGSPEFDAYLHLYDGIAASEDYKATFRLLRTIQDTNNIHSVYLLYFDLPTESTVYLVDASYEDFCAPGCFDAVMYDVDHEAVANPKGGIAPDITNTEEYGWLVAAGSPVFLGDELIAFVGADISMNEVMAQRNRFLLITLIALLVLAAVSIALSVLLIDRTIVRPINMLSDTSERYWSGGPEAIRHEFSQLHIHTGDEIEALSNSMKQMEQNINDHITKILETTQTLISTKERAEEMDRAANIDALTKVRNKRAYDVEIARVEQELRTGKTDVGIAMIDMNYLKRTNDIYGHEQGNASLRKLCQTICGVFKHSPVFRIGGDEFVVILENHDYAHLDELKARFEAELQKLQNTESPWESVSAAVGYAIYEPGTDDGMESVFKRADEQMYEQKKRMKAGRS